MKEFFSDGGKQKAKVRASVLTAGKKKTPDKKEGSPQQTNGTDSGPSPAVKTTTPPPTNGQTTPAPNNVSTISCSHFFPKFC